VRAGYEVPRAGITSRRPRRALRLSIAAVCAAAALLALLPGLAPAATRDVLFVGNSGDGTVDIFDATTFAHLESLNAIPDGNTPQDPVQALAYPTLVSRVGINYVQDLAVSPDGSVLYVSRGYLGDVAAFSLRTHALLWRVQTQSLRADHAELSPDGTRLFVSALTSDVVEVFDTRSHALVGVIPAGDWPHTLGFSPDGNTVYAGSLGVQLLDMLTPLTPPTDGRHWLEAIDPHTLLLERPPCVFSEGIRPFVLTADGRTMYLQLSYYNGIVEYDPFGCRTLRTLDLPLMGPGKVIAPHDWPNLAAQHGIAMSPDGKWLCSAGTIDDYAALVKLPDFSFAATKLISVGQEPAWAVNSPDGSYCFISSRGPQANTVSVLSYATQAEVTRLKTGLHPQTELAARVPVSVLSAASVRRPSGVRSRSGVRKRLRRR
jgi:DNA-binding beta-propeller fold protein YncE